MNKTQLIELLNDLVKQPKESEWVEFNLNFHSEQEIGESISALSNGAAIHNQDYGCFHNELFQLPPINVITDENRTRVTMYCYKSLNDLDKKEKIRACYQHACLKWVSNEKMSNQSLRERFQIEDKNAAIASRIIKDTFEAGMIKEDDPENKSRKHRNYVPFWA